MDAFVPSQRSEIMRRVRSSGTRPEIIVRKILRGMGIKYRSCLSSLPGKPDLVIAKQQKTIFVHGCFWHGGAYEAHV
jgi:DNA mismatch endonuclease, patch repair protein